MPLFCPLLSMIQTHLTFSPGFNILYIALHPLPLTQKTLASISKLKLSKILKVAA